MHMSVLVWFHCTRSLLQAMILHPLLLCKVRAWAATFNGCFPLFELATTEAGGRLFLTEAEAKASGSRAGRLVFAKLKGVTRSTEKLARSYGKVTITATKAARAHKQVGR